jgi:predicted nucleic acid-binding protein
LLRSIFGVVLIVPAVKREVIDEGVRGDYPDAGLIADALAQGHIVVRKSSGISTRALKLSRQENISQCDAEMLILARTLRRPLLVDERELSRLGKMWGLEVWNTWTVLLEALRRELIGEEEIHGAVRELGEKRHKLSSKDLKGILGEAKKMSGAEAL